MYVCVHMTFIVSLIATSTVHILHNEYTLFLQSQIMTLNRNNFKRCLVDDPAMDTTYVYPAFEAWLLFHI